MNRRRFLMISAASLVAGRAGAEVTTWQSDALGGTLRVDLRGPRGLADETSSGIAAIIEEVEAAASLFRPDSALSRLNAGGRLDDPPQALRDMLALSDALHRQTEGLFDPTVQPLWRALAEGGDAAQARGLIGWGRVRLGDRIEIGSGQSLTLNGLAQGYAADRVRGRLAEAGYGPALIDMGEFAAIGGPFLLGIEDPDLGVVATRRVTGGAVATSSPAAMRIGGQDHILGPRGEPPAWSTISVEAESAALADGLSTAICLMPLPHLRDVVGRMSGVSRIVAVSLAGDVLSLQGPAG